MKRTGDALAVLVTAAAVAFIGACGSSGDGGTGACTAGSTCAQVAGTWSTVEYVGTSACGGAYTKYNSYTVMQTACNLSVEPVSGGGTFTGGINKNSICWTGSYLDSGGRTTINSLSLTVDPSGTSFHGTAHWTWTDGSMSCSGTTSINGTKS